MDFEFWLILNTIRIMIKYISIFPRKLMFAIIMLSRIIQFLENVFFKNMFEYLIMVRLFQGWQLAIEDVM